MPTREEVTARLDILLRAADERKEDYPVIVKQILALFPTIERECPDCKGTGKIIRRPTIEELEGILAQEDVPLEILPNGEIRAQGQTKTEEMPCPTCQGSGKVRVPVEQEWVDRVMETISKCRTELTRLTALLVLFEMHDPFVEPIRKGCEGLLEQIDALGGGGRETRLHGGQTTKQRSSGRGYAKAHGHGKTGYSAGSDHR